eukprot:CAMPEP_0172676612 /NCGR_PEP_ID=MMETSP1074-20121228/14110_1 /TAXON_ID=2916 /ORGANISM="Ceratium fusus, Strain PA161109" /LENGTH=38 /DNA_ID= /DNA_START= /DNA_END= /DNA_ORIENTATION=
MASSMSGAAIGPANANQLSQVALSRASQCHKPHATRGA